MNLSILKNNLFLIIIFTIIIIGFVLFLIFASRERERPIAFPTEEYPVYADMKTEVTNNSKFFTDLIYSKDILTNLELPESLPIYDYSQLSYTDEDINNLVRNLNMTISRRENQGQPNEIVFASNQEGILTFYKDASVINYSKTRNYSEPIIGLRTDMTIEDYESIANKFFKTIELDIDKYSYEGHYYMDSTQAHLVSKPSPNGATLVIINYHANIDGYPLLDQTYDLYPSTVSIYINGNDEVTKAIIQYIGDEEKKLYNVKTRSIEDIEKQLDNGRVNLINTGLPMGELIVKVYVTELDIRYITSKNRAVPILVGKTQNITNNGDEGQGLIMIDLVEFNSADNNE